MTTYSTSISVAAPIERVWDILTRVLPQHPEPFGILRFEGDLARNRHIRIWSEVDPKRAFALKVVAFQPPERMVWQGGMPLGLFTGTRTFSLSPMEGVTTFHMQEVFGGLLSGLIVKSIPDLTPSFEKFANALKEKAEHDE